MGNYNTARRLATHGALTAHEESQLTRIGAARPSELTGPDLQGLGSMPVAGLRAAVEAARQNDNVNMEKVVGAFAAAGYAEAMRQQPPDRQAAHAFLQLANNALGTTVETPLNGATTDQV